MRRWLWLGLLGLVIGVLVSSVLSLDPGYALFQVAGYRLETTLVAFVLVLLAGALLLRLLMRFLSGLFAIGPAVGRWFGKRQEEREVDLIHGSFDDILSDDAGSLARKIARLEKLPWFSASRAERARDWLLVRQIGSAKKLDQLKKMWASASVRQRESATLRLHFVEQLHALDASADAEAELLRLAETSWPSAANALIAVSRPSDIHALSVTLTTLFETTKSAPAQLGLTLLESWTLDRDQAEALLVAAYRKAPSEHLIRALGARRLA